MAKPKKRSALEALTKKRLTQLVRAFELDVPSSRPKAELVDALASSKKASFRLILDELNRTELKDICRAHDMDDSGKLKAKITARILGEEPADAPTEPKAPKQAATKRGTKKRGSKKSAAKSASEPEQMSLPEPESGEKLTRETLEKYLWSAADILRGSIDSSDYKNYIFGLLFLKRLSDTFEEVAEALVAEGEDPEVAWNDPDEHRFFVPERARWGVLARTSTELGATLNKACAALEEAVPALEGVLDGIDWNDGRKLGEAKNRDAVLARLIQHFSRLRLRNADLSEPDMLGRAYEYLIEKFADDAGKKGGEFYTPSMVVKLIVELLAPTERMSICDPTCGSGGMLVQCVAHVKDKGGNPRNLVLHGQEKNLGTWAICKMNLLLHGLPDARIEKGDTIREPKLLREGELITYDRVIANPPFSLDEWGREVAEDDGFGRFRFGVPPKTKGDMAFVQHMIATLGPKGRMGVVMPHGVLFRGSAEGRIREAILREDLFEAVIGLPAGLFYGTGIPAAVLVLNRDKAPARKGKLLFVEASREFAEGSNQNALREQDVVKIAKAFHAFESVDKYARVVGLEEIEKNDFNLNISRYVDTADAVEAIDVGAAVKRLRELERERGAAEAQMNAFLEELGYG